MPIDIYMFKVSPPCRAVLMTALEINVKLNEKLIDPSKGELLSPDFVKLNPTHAVPAIDDNGFVMWESRAIMQFLCNKYAPDSTLYPKDAKLRAQVDMWLNMDISLYIKIRQTLVTGYYGMPVKPEDEKQLWANIKLIDQLIGNRQYLVGDRLTIADLSLLATSAGTTLLDQDLTEYPHFKQWSDGLAQSLPYYQEINIVAPEVRQQFINNMKAYMSKMKEMMNK
ncbi:glutathione S-transferase 1-like [Oppia nitens]|uniref:glutathione S-transferase 1-like n=1 Tax=Oppia nitens TaxID=1686743 RepID=UPI0023DB684F|nr:glutathione S-transferase 1-like [Oppia nitens]